MPSNPQDSNRLIENQELFGALYDENPNADFSKPPPVVVALARKSNPETQTEGERLRDEGMERAASARKELLLRAQSIARLIAMESPNRTCASDDVQELMTELGIDPSELGNAAGSLFRGKGWTLVTTRKSRRTAAHARRIGVWRLKT
jgi:hypothetical protein